MMDYPLIAWCLVMVWVLMWWAWLPAAWHSRAAPLPAWLCAGYRALCAHRFSRQEQGLIASCTVMAALALIKAGPPLS